MFKTEKIPAFLQAVKFNGKDGLEFTFYLNAVTHELVSEVADWMADIMFRRDSDGRWQPVKGLPSGELDDPNVPVQMMSLHPVPEEEHENLGAMLPNASTYGFKSLRLFDDKTDLTLAFNVRVERNKLSLELGDRYFRKKEGLFLSFAPMEAELPMDHPNDTVDGNALCQECNIIASVIDSDKRAWCNDHLRLAQGEIRELHPERRETPQQAAERVEKERARKDAAKQKDLAELRGELGGLIGEPGGPPAVDGVDLKADGAFVNGRAKSRNGKKPRKASRGADGLAHFEEPEPQPSAEIGQFDVAAWGCRMCGCLWRDNQDGSVSLADAGQKSCVECEHRPTVERG